MQEAPRVLESHLVEDVLLDHWRRPRCKGSISDGLVAEGSPPGCSDYITVYGSWNSDGTIRLRFLGSGCVLSQAATSLVLAELDGKAPPVTAMMGAGFLRGLLGDDIVSRRSRCAFLGITLVREVLERMGAAQSASAGLARPAGLPKVAKQCAE